MKKKYTAPRICIEHFEMTEHIAACGSTNVTDGNEFGTPNHYDGDKCVFRSNDNVVTMFLNGNTQCTTKTDPDNMIVGCYNTPDGTLSMFAS